MKAFARVVARAKSGSKRKAGPKERHLGGIEEVHEHKELVEVVLEGRPGEQDAVLAAQVVQRLGQLRLGALQPVTLVHHLGADRVKLTQHYFLTFLNRP